MRRIDRAAVKSFILFSTLVIVIYLFSPHAAYAGWTTFWAHKEARGFVAGDNMMDQASPEPNQDSGSATAASTGEKVLPSTNSGATVGLFWTAPWNQSLTIASTDTWTFNVWGYTDGSSVVAYFRVKVYQYDASLGTTSLLFTTTDGTQIPYSATSSPSERSWTYTGTAVTLATSDRLKFEFYTNVATKQTGKKVYWRFDNTAANLGNTRVDVPNVTYAVPTLGNYLLALAVGFFIIMAVRRGALSFR